MDERCPTCGTHNGPAVQRCRQCGATLGETASSRWPDTSTLDRPVVVAAFDPDGGARRGQAVALRVGALVLLLAGGVWWMTRPSAAVTAATGAAVPLRAASASAAGAVTAPVPTAVADEATVPVATVDAASAPESPAASAPRPVRTRDNAALASARVQRELEAQRLADAEAQRLRAVDDAARPAVVPAAPEAVTEPAPPPPARPRTAQELCASGGAIGRGICLARACIGAEHAEEAACQQLRAADDARRN